MRPSPGGVSDGAFSRTLPGAAFGLAFLATLFPSTGIYLDPKGDVVGRGQELHGPIMGRELRWIDGALLPVARLPVELVEHLFGFVRDLIHGLHGLPSV